MSMNTSTPCNSGGFACFLRVEVSSPLVVMSTIDHYPRFRIGASLPHRVQRYLLAMSDYPQTAHPVVCRAMFPAPGPQCRKREESGRSRTQPTNRPLCLDFFAVLSRVVAAGGLLSAQRP